MQQLQGPAIGDLLRHWRVARRMSQLDLSLETEISARHICFIETGRSKPSRETVLKIAEQLEVPIRDRNLLLQAAGYSPIFMLKELSDPELSLAHEAVSLIVNGHDPYPAIAIDRQWNLVLANNGARRLMASIDPALWSQPLNVIRLSLHPQGLAPVILNLGEWRRHILHRLRRESMLSGDSGLRELIEEVSAYPCEESSDPALDTAIVIPLRMMVEGQPLSLISATTVFGTAIEVTLSELTLETFFPADKATADFFLAELRK